MTAPGSHECLLRASRQPPLRHLRVLDLSFCRFRALDATLLAEAVVGADELRVATLKLTGAQLGDAGVASLLLALGSPAASAITSLGLGVNSLTDASAEALAAAASAGGALTSLRELRLGGNSIGEEGARALAGALHDGGAHLATLHLGHTCIGDAGGEALALALCTAESGSEACSLRVLQLQSCGCGPRAAAAWTQAGLRPRPALRPRLAHARAWSCRRASPRARRPQNATTRDHSYLPRGHAAGFFIPSSIAIIVVPTHHRPGLLHPIITNGNIISVSCLSI